MKIIHYCDPGHGWFKVSRLSIANLGLLEKISGYSYQRADSVYLEEDGDASMYLNACDKAGIKYEIITQHTDKQSKIRNYESFNVVAPLKLEYIPMIDALSRVLDKKELNCRNAESIKRWASEILVKFRYESQYSKKPDTPYLKKLANWTCNVVRIEECAA